MSGQGPWPFALSALAVETIALDADVPVAAPAPFDVRLYRIDGVAGQQWSAGISYANALGGSAGGEPLCAGRRSAADAGQRGCRDACRQRAVHGRGASQQPGGCRHAVEDPRQHGCSAGADRARDVDRAGGHPGARGGEALPLRRRARAGTRTAGRVDGHGRAGVDQRRRHQRWLRQRRVPRHFEPQRAALCAAERAGGAQPVRHQPQRGTGDRCGATLPAGSDTGRRGAGHRGRHDRGSGAAHEPRLRAACRRQAPAVRRLHRRHRQRRQRTGQGRGLGAIRHRDQLRGRPGHHRPGNCVRHDRQPARRRQHAHFHEQPGGAGTARLPARGPGRADDARRRRRPGERHPRGLPAPLLPLRRCWRAAATRCG